MVTPALHCRTFARRLGYDVTIVMPENMTEERKQILKELGAELVVVSAEGSFAEAAGVRDELSRERGYFNPDQFSNPLNVACHYETTGQEILRQLPKHTEAPIDAFVAGVGTGGTLMGVGKAIRERYPDARLVAVEPSESPVMSGGEPGVHGIYGIGDGFIPAIVSDDGGGLSPMIDEVVCVDSKDAKDARPSICRPRSLVAWESLPARTSSPPGSSARDSRPSLRSFPTVIRNTSRRDCFSAAGTAPTSTK